MERTQNLTLDAKWIDRLRVDFRSARITDDEMCHALQRVYEVFGYVADPHTAVAMAATEQLGYSLTVKHISGKEKPVAILATASPCKFEEAVTAALGKEKWEKWKMHYFPLRAQDTMNKMEVEPIHYLQKEGAPFSDIQTEWRRKMLDIVKNNF